MFKSKPFPFMPVPTSPYDQGSDARHGLANRDSNPAPIFVVRPKATARYNDKGELIPVSAAKAITPNDQPSIASQAAADPIIIQTGSTTSEPQREGAAIEGKALKDELVIAVTIRPLDDPVTATQDCAPFKQADECVVADHTAAVTQYALHIPMVESADAAEPTPIAMAPFTNQTEPDTAAKAFKHHISDGKPHTLNYDDGSFKHSGTEQASARESWLQEAVNRLSREVFLPAGHTVPLVKVSVGFPSKKAVSKVNRTIGQCWSRDASADGVNQIFINPTLTSPVEFVDVLAHELVHAVDDCKSGHKHAFQKICKAVGLTEGRPASASAGPELMRTIEDICADLGTFPHAALSPGDNEKVQTTRLRKIECLVCGWTGRTTAKWAAIGLPTCHCGSKLVPTLRCAPAVDEQPVQLDTASSQPSLI